LPIALAGYFAYGGAVLSNVVLSITDGPIRIVVEVMLLLHLVKTVTGDRCYDFLNIFAEKFSENIGVFWLKLLLVCEKIDHNIGL
jgi:hypothetical protein